MEHVKPDVQYHFHNTFTENPINNDDKHDTTPVGTTKQVMIQKQKENLQPIIHHLSREGKTF